MLALLLFAACQASAPEPEPAPAAGSGGPPHAQGRSEHASAGSGATAVEAAAPTPDDLARAAEVVRLISAFDAEERSWREARASVKDPAERTAWTTAHPRPDPSGTARELWTLVVAEPGDEAALSALQWLLRYDQDGRRAAGIVVEHHVRDERIGQVVPLLGRVGGGPECYERIVRESPHREVRGLALYEQAALLVEEGGLAQEHAVPLLEAVVRDYGDVGSGRRNLGDRARGDLREIRLLAVGKPAPDIEGEDIDGTPFKLSDYRGKVVLLDFWGDW
jgi:hypothetical protein